MDDEPAHHPMQVLGGCTMITTRSSLLALASSLEAQGEALKAQAASIRATLEAGAAQPASAADTVNVEGHARALGCSLRKAREFMLRAEREGFAVRRVGRSLFLARDEWERAVDALRSTRERPKVTAHDPDALLDSVGSVPIRKRAKAA